MAHQLYFSATHKYDSTAVGITVPVLLAAGGQELEFLAKIDTGATDCLFQRDIGEQIGLEIEAGVQKPFSTVHSQFQAYGHDVSIKVLGIETTARVYFYGDPHITRNVLGRRGWLDRIRLGLIDYEQSLFLSGYDH